MTSSRGSASVQEAAALGFERGDDHAGVGPFVHVARADAHVPAGGAPFGELVVGQRAGGHGEHGLTLERGIEQLEDVRLARAGRRVDDHVAARAQGGDRLLLPEIGDAQTGFERFQKNRRGGGFFHDRGPRHAGKLPLATAGYKAQATRVRIQLSDNRLRVVVLYALAERRAMMPYESVLRLP